MARLSRKRPWARASSADASATATVDDPLADAEVNVLADASDRELYAEAKRRGWQMLPLGAFEGIVGELEAKLAAAESKRTDAEAILAAATPRSEFMGTVDKLAYIAGKEFPEAVRENGRLLAENTELTGRVERAETEASQLAAALVADEFPEHTDHD